MWFVFPFPARPELQVEYFDFAEVHSYNSLLSSQATDGDQHPLLDRAASERPLAVAWQGAHTDGLPQHPLLQRLLGKPVIYPPRSHHNICLWLKTQMARRLEQLPKYGKMMTPPIQPNFQM